MVTQNPVFFDSTTNVHRPMDTGATVPPSTVPVSAVTGNTVQTQGDGIYVGNRSGLAVYVDSVAGNDANAGTSSAAPFLTLDHAFAFLNSLFPGGIYAGQNVTIALKAGQNYPVSSDFTVYRNTDIQITFYGDANYGNWNSGIVGTGANPWLMSNLARPQIQPQISSVSGLWKIAGINRQGGNVIFLGVTIQLPAAPSNPSISLYSGYSDFVRSVTVADDGFVQVSGVIVNMTDITAYWGFLGAHARSFTKLYEYCTQFQIQGKVMSAANAPTNAQLAQRQYFIKFYQDYAGNNQQVLNLSTTSSNSAAGSGMIFCSWSDASALVVTGTTTNLASYPLAFDPGYGLINYIFNLTKTANGQPLNFLSSRLF